MTRSPAWQRAAIVVLLGLGVALRLRAYLANRSLWLDESYLVLNLLERDFAGLLRPLDNTQAAAPGFLLAQRLIIDVFGSSEYALRALPFVASIGALFVFWRWASTLLPPAGTMMAVAIFAISEPLLHYAVEVKQYGLDVAIAVVLWSTFTTLKPRLDADHLGAWALVALLGATAIWCSHPAVFVIGGVALHWLWQALRVAAWKSLVVRVCVSITWAASFGILYMISLRVVSASFRAVWRGAEAPLVPLSSGHVSKYVDLVSTLCILPLGARAVQLAMLSAIVGVIALWRRGYRQGGWFAGTLALVWIASSLGKYPVAMRLWLFLAPVMILVVALGVDEVWRRTRPTFPVLAPILACALLAYPALGAAQVALRPREKEEIRPLLQHMRDRYRDGDVFYVYRPTQWAARYYAARGLGFPGEVIIGTGGQGGRDHGERDVEELHGRGRVWVLFAHVLKAGGLDDEKLFLYLLDRVGVQRDARRETGASLYLYDLSRAP